jgi:glycosyltransferase involved in cell wall biosynthesis
VIRVSAVIPTFDRHHLLPVAVASVLGQTEPPDEVLVVDNGFTPVDADSLPKGVRLVRITAGAGVSVARNVGVAEAQHEYVAFLDDDDRWTPTYLAEVRAAIARHPQRATVIIGNKHREIEGIVAPYKMIGSLEGLRDVLLYTNPGVAGQNLTVARDFHLERHRGFRPELRGPEDRAYLIDAIDAGAEICLASDAVVIKVMHPGEQLTDGRRIRKVLRFSAIYWRSMGRMQRIDNTRKVLYALRDMFRRRVRRRSA